MSTPSAVNAGLTPVRRRHGRRRYTETRDFGAMVARMIRAYARRVADADIEDLRDLAVLRDTLDQVIAVTGRPTAIRAGRVMAAVNRPVKASTLTLGCDELPEEADPLRCLDCLAEGDACAFHAGFADGWDACMAAVAQWVNRDDD